MSSVWPKLGAPVLAVLVAALLVPSSAGASADPLDGRTCEKLGPVPLATPVAPPGPCSGVRPGARVVSPLGGCTLNFLFAGSDGATYAGTAGHCILEDGGESVWTSIRPVARDGSGSRVGEFVYAVQGSSRDFALIRVDAGVETSNAMCHFGGPTGLYQGTSITPVVLHHYGQGVGFGSVVPGRTAVAPNTSNPDLVFAEGAASFGDSGSGVISADGRALGVLVWLVVPTPSRPGYIAMTRVAPQVARAEEKLGISLTLRTAGLAP